MNLPLIGIWVRLLTIPYRFLYPVILVLICIGVYAVGSNVYDVVQVFVFGFLGYLMMQVRLEPAPLLLGFVLGPLLEDNFRRALILSRGDLAVFVERPISLSLLLASVAVIAFSLRRPVAAMPDVDRSKGSSR